MARMRGNGVTLKHFPSQCKKMYMFDFKLHTGLLQLFLHTKTAHGHFLRAEHTSYPNNNLTPLIYLPD